MPLLELLALPLPQLKILWSQIVSVLDFEFSVLVSQILSVLELDIIDFEFRQQSMIWVLHLVHDKG